MPQAFLILHLIEQRGPICLGTSCASCTSARSKVGPEGGEGDRSAVKSTRVPDAGVRKRRGPHTGGLV